jgi:hypothetical protein
VIAWAGKVINGSSIAEVEARKAKPESVGESCCAGLVLQFEFLAFAVIVTYANVEVL